MEYPAVLYILGTPGLWERAAPYVRRNDIDWKGLLEETRTMSGGQTLLVKIAYELWTAKKTVGLWEIVRRLDAESFERVIDALAMSRGTPAQQLRAA
jgi:hypothetical protein